MKHIAIFLVTIINILIPVPVSSTSISIYLPGFISGSGIFVVLSKSTFFVLKVSLPPLDIASREFNAKFIIIFCI